LLASIPRLSQDPGQPLPAIGGLPPDLAHPPPGCRFAARCRYATDQCRAQEPPLSGMALSGMALSGVEGEHRFACWHPVDGPLPPPAVTDTGEASEPAPPANGVPATDGVAAGREPLLDLRNLIREYPVTSGAVLRRKVAAVHAVSGVSFSVPAGATFGLVGESGSGKTTVGKMIVALEKPDAGDVRLAGVDLATLGGPALRRQRRDLQLMFQDPLASLDPRMRVGSILAEPLAVQHSGHRPDRRRRVLELLGEVGLPASAVERYPHEFSGGQRQRIGLARALALNPRLIVADEPVSALDVSIRAQVLNLMKRLQADHGLTYVVISHDLTVVRYLADRIGVMYLGKLVEIGSRDDIYTRTAHPYTAGLIGAIPVPDPEVEQAKSGPAVSGELPSPIHPPSGCRFRTRCPRAQVVCGAEEPPLRPFGPGHVAACHFPLQSPVQPALS
jgi:oligopeptide/dipeptide ABC transporter ATP-binding protein